MLSGKDGPAGFSRVSSILVYGAPSTGEQGKDRLGRKCAILHGRYALRSAAERTPVHISHCGAGLPTSHFTSTHVITLSRVGPAAGSLLPLSAAGRIKVSVGAAANDSSKHPISVPPSRHCSSQPNFLPSPSFRTFLSAPPLPPHPTPGPHLGRQPAPGGPTRLEDHRAPAQSALGKLRFPEGLSGLVETRGSPVFGGSAP